MGKYVEGIVNVKLSEYSSEVNVILYIYKVIGCRDSKNEEEKAVYGLEQLLHYEN